MRCANSRASTSFGPPAANGLIMVSDRAGQSSALTPDASDIETIATSALTAFHMISSEHSFDLTSDERDRFRHLEDFADFDQRALEVGFCRGCAQTKPNAEAFALHAPQGAG